MEYAGPRSFSLCLSFSLCHSACIGPTRRMHPTLTEAACAACAPRRTSGCTSSHALSRTNGCMSSYVLPRAACTSHRTSDRARSHALPPQKGPVRIPSDCNYVHCFFFLVITHKGWSVRMDGRLKPSITKTNKGCQINNDKSKFDIQTVTKIWRT
jgi:hypothetical protein